MDGFDEKLTEKLLENLDWEIDRKCAELKEKQLKYTLEKAFFLGCVLVTTLFIMQLFFSIFNINFIVALILYLMVSASITLPLLINTNKGGVINGLAKQKLK